MQKQQQPRGLLRMGLLKAGESEVWGRRTGARWVSEEGHQWLLSTMTALHLWQRKSSSEIATNPAAKGHGEHRPISETELGRKSFSADWGIFREL